jgi:exonuclease SbcD
MKLLHTSDWHLGHTLHGLSRELEHEVFLAWLLDTLEARATDALIVAGDIFDSANPPASAQRLFYRFLADARRRCPELEIVVVAGNHDSASRLEAPRPLLDGLGMHVVGALARTVDGDLDATRLLVPLRSRGGATEAWCLAVPFLRPVDLWTADSGEGDPLIDAVRAVYREAVERAAERLRPGQALVATGHLYMVGGQVSALSERKILGGNQHALPADLFGPRVAYAALGHLHLAQAVGGRDTVRYSGAPLPLSLDEGGYPHQVVEVELAAGGVSRIDPLRTPRTVEILRVPGADHAPLEAVLDALKELALDRDLAPERWPYLEVRVRLERPEPGLRRQVEEALAGRPVRLLKISPVYAGTKTPLADATPARLLQEITPDEVFRLRYGQCHEGEPPPELLDAYHALLEQVQAGGEP